MDNNNINKLIGLIYDAAMEPSKWSDLLNSLAEYVDYVDTQAVLANPEQDVLSVIPAISVIGEKQSKTTISETLKSLTSLNDDTAEVVPAELGEVNDLLISHFARAIKIAKRLIDIDEQHEVVLSLLDRLPIALVLVDANAKIIESNVLADELLEAKTGLSVQKGTLIATEENKEKLHHSIHLMSKHDPATSRGQTLAMTNEVTKNSLMLFLAPLKHHGIDQKASVAVFIAQRKSQPLNLPPELAEIYGLTDKEMAITSQLVRGLSIKEISCESSVSEHTVRTQVKSVMKKTQTSRQAELVSLVYNGMGTFVNSIPAVVPGGRKGLLAKAKAWQQNYKVLQLDDGRNLAWQEYGDPEGEPVVHCHSVLGSRMELALNGDEISQNKSVRLIVIDRPGFGASDPDPDMSYIKWVGDLVQLVNYLEIKQFSITGYAMGGMYALACAHEIPERLNKIALISAGMPAESSSDYEQIIPLYKMNIRLAKYLPKVYKLLSDVLVKGVINDPAGFFSQLSEKMDAADQEIMKNETFKTEMFASLQEGFLQGGKATAFEIIQLMHDWGFKPKNITIPVDIWHGDCDHHVPLVLAQRFKQHLKHTEYFICEGQGHYLFYQCWEEILEQTLLVSAE